MIYVKVQLNSWGIRAQKCYEEKAKNAKMPIAGWPLFSSFQIISRLGEQT